MDSPPPPPKPHKPRPVPPTFASRTISSSRAPDRSSSGGSRSEIQPDLSGLLRRGHSDGDVLGPPLRGYLADRRTEEESWMDFLHDTPRRTENADDISQRHVFRGLGGQDLGTRQERQATMQRAALMLADRKRRLTETQEDYARRRSASSLPFGPASLERSGYVSSRDSRYRSLSDLNSPLPPRPLPPRPQPQLREEDECPICHQALPPKGPNGSETAREAHVAECIEQHFSSSTPRSARPHPSTATDAAISANAANASQSQAAGGRNIPSNDRNQRRESTGIGTGSESAFQRMGSQRRRVAGMVSYMATEKDCMGEVGEPAECVICFEEFEQGAQMGRLECLCKFHKVRPMAKIHLPLGLVL
ncbi:MAG: hypothetical protein Q9170_003099 [Blastenia crenularia]